MSNSIEALDLPLQLFALGTVLGTTGALIHQIWRGENKHWQLYVAVPSTALFFGVILHTIVRVVF
jgi:hypothetical protein